MLEGEDRVRKGALAFLSQDRLHDFQQVEKFEELVFKYIQKNMTSGLSNGSAGQINVHLNLNLSSQQNNFDGYQQ